MRVFISYRRTAGRPSAVVQSVKSGLDRQRAAGDETILDLSHVHDQKTFASELVAALNRSDALLVVVDESWLRPANQDFLKHSGGQAHSTDWVEFELRYAIQHRLVIACVAEKRNVGALQRVPWPPGLSDLGSRSQFETDAAGMSREESELLMSGLRVMCTSNERLPSTLSAGDIHNLPRLVDVSEAESIAADASAVVSAIGMIEWLTRTLLVGIGFIGMLGGAAMLTSGKFLEGALALGLSLGAMVLAKFVRQAWVLLLRWRVELKSRRRR